MPYMDNDVRARVAELVEEIETSSFRETKWGRRGYSEREVDEFLDYLVDVLFALLSSATPELAGAEAEPEVLPLEETELHVGEDADEAEAVAAPEGEATEIVAAPDADEAEAVAAPEGEATEIVAAPDGSEGDEEERSVPVATEGQPPLPPWIGPDG